MRVGVVDVAGAGVQVEEDVEAAVRAAAAALERAGATLAPLSLPELAALRIAGGAIQALEATAYHETRLRERYRELGPFARGRLLIGFAYPAGAFVRAQQARATLRASWTQRWDGFDLTLLPVLATAPPARGTVPGTAFTVPINVLGWPSATVPIGRTASGLPGAVQVVGRPWRESDVMRAAAALSAGAPA
jgi:aspartyl-tRNA(Asn)/glutamyl-tRNA(Gln) amidotransferase subunit A